MEHLPIATRIRGLREFMNTSRSGFENVTGIKRTHLHNIENFNQKPRAEDLETICKLFPEFTKYLVFQGEIDFLELEKNTSTPAQIIAARIKNNELPSGYGFNECIINVPK